MNAAIIGYGKMGHEIENILTERGHRVSLIIDADNRADLTSEKLDNIDVALEFTTPDTAYDNIRACLDADVAVVSGTTGWTARLDELQKYCTQRGGAMFYASNYCLGVNFMFRATKSLSEMIGRVGGYQVSIEEVHHTQKKDSPSGTAITLAEAVIDNVPYKTGWVNSTDANETQIAITSIREGSVPGIHTITYESQDDIIEMRHTIKNRRTLAMGAVIAAEFICGKHGIFTMDDLLK